MKRDILSSVPGNLKTPAIVSSVLVMPFMILELVNRRDFNDEFPIVLFGLMWLLTLSFIIILMPIVRALPRNRRMPNHFTLLASVLLLILIAGLCVGLVRDQLPCFLGVPNCD